MKAIISSTYDDNYLFFIPITTWLWDKLGVDIICFLPEPQNYERLIKFNLVINTMVKQNIFPKNGFHHFKCPEHKEATYSQCSRLYAACLGLPEDEILITSDVDMGLFKIPPYIDGFTIFGSDLTPPNQYPMCYISAKVKDWKNALCLHDKTYQQSLDELLGHIETEHFRGNYWGKDQEEAYNKINANQSLHLVKRARPQTQFASNRVDRDDSFWEERLNWDIIDAHLWRPAYIEENMNKILKLLSYFYPNDDIEWLNQYAEKYRKLV